MYSWDEPGDRVAIAQMNSELRHAQLDLLSAQCATDRLRLRFSVEDLARYGERDVLRKTIGTAVALHEYYRSLQNEMGLETATLSEAQIVHAVKRVGDYLWNQRECISSVARPWLPVRKKPCKLSFRRPCSNGYEPSNCMAGASPLPRSIPRHAPWASTICRR
jgi:hypothetical protein